MAKHRSGNPRILNQCESRLISTFRCRIKEAQRKAEKELARKEEENEVPNLKRNGTEGGNCQYQHRKEISL